jgi:hypothetical protein
MRDSLTLSKGNNMKKILLDLCVVTFGCLLIMAGPLLQAIGVIGG